MKSKVFSINVLFIALLFSMNSQSQINSTFRSDNEHSGIYKTTEIQNPSIKWKCNLNGIVFSSPAISKNIAYIGSGDHNLYAINTKNGEIIWSFKTNGEIRSTPAVNNNKVYFVSNDGNFYALDKISGAEKWRFKTEGEKQFSAVNLFGYDTEGVDSPDPWDLYLSSPVIENDIVYFGSGDSHIYALNTETGKQVWKFKTGNVVHSSPAISNGIVYCGSFDSKLYALDAKTGTEIWNYQSGTDERYYLMCGIQSSPSVSDGVVYFGSRDANVYAVEASSGKLKWKQQFGGSWMPSSTAITDKRIYVGSSDAKKYFSLDKETGSVIDSINTYSYTFSSPAISGNTVYIGVFNGYVYAFDKSNSKIKWTFKTDASNNAINTYITSEGRIKKEMRAGIAYKVVSDMQKSLKRYFSIGAIVSSPVIDNGVLYVSSSDGYLYAIN